MVVPSPNGAAYPYRVSIVETKQVFVEGIEEVRVFSELAGHLEMSGIQIHPYGGRDKLRQFLRVLASRDDFDNVRSLAVVADADFDVGAARDSIRGALRDAGLPVPSAPLVEASQDDLRYFTSSFPTKKKECWKTFAWNQSGLTLQWNVLNSLWDVSGTRGRIGPGGRLMLKRRYTRFWLPKTLRISDWGRPRRRASGILTTLHSTR